MTLSPLFAAAGTHLWQSTVAVAVIWLLTVTVLRHSSPAVRHALWLAASLKFLVPFSTLVTAGASLAWLRPEAEPTRGVDALFVQISTTVPPAVVAPGRLLTMSEATWSPLPWLALIWACGATLVAIRWVLQWRQVRAAVRRSTRLDVESPIPVLSYSASAACQWEPGVFGLFRPVVLVPSGIENHLTSEQFAAVLLHEQHHAARRDNVAAAAHTIVEALFWFHPLVWWIGRRMESERERACDEAVIVSGANPSAYAEGLLRVCRFYVESPYAVLAGVTGADLKRRVHDIMTWPVSRRLGAMGRMLLTAAAATAVAGPILFGLIGTGAIAAQSTGGYSFGLITTAEKTFDVASIKENLSGSPAWRVGVPRNGSVSIDNLELKKLIATSFRTQDKMVVGGPSWIESKRYDIVGKGDPGTPNPEVWEMMRSLLLERFHLTYHLEMREMPVYAMTIARGGLKLGDPAKGRCGDALKEGRPCSNIRFLPYGVAIDNLPISALIAVLARTLQDRPIIDATGLPLSALHDAVVMWTPFGAKPEEIASVPSEFRPPDVNMFEAFEQQAGLKIESRRGPVQLLVIDSVDPPDPN